VSGAAAVRLATRSDVPALAELRRAWTEEVGGQVEDTGYDDAFAAWFDHQEEQRVTWVLEVGAALVGMVNVLVFTRMPRPRPAEGPRPPAQWGYVANMYVAPARRGAGLGGLLLDAVVAHADAHGFARLVLSPSERSVPFYARAGFGPATSLLVRPAGGPA
jgi:GNAT superfamily N-acetyltransferase